MLGLKINTFGAVWINKRGDGTLFVHIENIFIDIQSGEKLIFQIKIIRI